MDNWTTRNVSQSLHKRNDVPAGPFGSAKTSEVGGRVQARRSPSGRQESPHLLLKSSIASHQKGKGKENLELAQERRLLPV